MNRQRQSPRRYEQSLHYTKEANLSQTLKRAWRLCIRFALLWGDIYKQLIAPEKVQFVLIRSPRSDIITPGTSTVAKFKTMILWFARLQEVSNTASSKRLHYVWTIFPPNARFVPLCHHVTPPYSARRRLPFLMSCKTPSNYDNCVKG